MAQEPNVAVQLLPGPGEPRNFQADIPDIYNKSATSVSEGEGCAMTTLRYVLYLFCGLFAILPISWCWVCKTFKTYESGVVFRLGHVQKQAKEQGGLYFFLPVLDQVHTVDLRIKTYDIPSQNMMTKDSVTVSVNAAVLYHIDNAIFSVCHVRNVKSATENLAATTLRAVVGESELDEVLHSRERISFRIKQLLDAATDAWGVRVDEVQIKDIMLPPNMMRCMAAQAEAERERRGKVIAARGELQASEKLLQAAQEMTTNPVTMQLRFMQALTTIAQDKKSKVYFPLPISMSSLAVGQKTPE
jgi:regulator of protease activity HflC (stomatin/prohibitin superfamily)